MDFGAGIHVPEKTLLVLIAKTSASTALVSANGELEIYAK